MSVLINRSFRLPRVWSNTVLSRLGALFPGEVINVSGWDDRDKEGGKYRSYFKQATAYYTSNYSGERGTGDAADTTDFFLDLTQPLPDNLASRFDVVFNHTTLEHIFDVRKAFENLCLMSRDVVIVVVPFAQEMHYTSSFGDFWRFTPQCLRKLFEENGLTLIYESANPHKNAGIYLVAVGSRHPERWTGKMPEWHEIKKVGGWIGHNRLRKVAKLIERVGGGSSSNGNG